MNTAWIPLFTAWVRGLCHDYSVVQNDATMESLGRFRWAIWVMVPLHMFFAWEFGQYQINAGQEAWIALFDFDEDAMPVGAKALAALALDQLIQPK